MDEWKPLLALVAVCMTVAGHVPYLLATVRGTNRPHIFTWVIWTVLTGIACVAQLAGGAGVGAYVTAVTCVICIVITMLAWQYGERNIKLSDKVMFGAGLMAIPVWLVTSDPLWSVLVVVGIDCAAFWPTFRKSWFKPFEEDTFMYGFNVPRHAVALGAVQVFSWTTALYPAALLVMNGVMYVMLKIRRRRYGVSR